MRPVLFVAAIIVVVSLALPTAQTTNPLVGAWEYTEGTRADGTSVENPVGMIVFTNTHYSHIRVSGMRPQYASQAEATDAEKIAAFDTLAANAGTYEVSGSTLTLRPSVAKNPNVYAPGNSIELTFTIDGKTLATTSSTGVLKFVRVE